MWVLFCKKVLNSSLWVNFFTPARNDHKDGFPLDTAASIKKDLVGSALLLKLPRSDLCCKPRQSRKRLKHTFGGKVLALDSGTNWAFWVRALIPATEQGA